MLKTLSTSITSDFQTVNQLKPRGKPMPILYGLPKLRKPEIPIWPIFSMVNSPQHKLAKLLVKVLEPVRQGFCHYSLKDSFQSLNISEKFMFLYDVQSLFTNEPLDKTIDIMCKKTDRYIVCCLKFVQKITNFFLMIRYTQKPMALPLVVRWTQYCPIF